MPRAVEMKMGQMLHLHNPESDETRHAKSAWLVSQMLYNSSNRFGRRLFNEKSRAKRTGFLQVQNTPADARDYFAGALAKRR